MSTTETDLIAYLQQAFAPELILLGGSRAIGQARDNSDWDLYLIGDYPQENERVFRNLHGAHLDIALFPKYSIKDTVLRIYFGPLRVLRPLLDNAAGEATVIANATRVAYERGPGFPSEDRITELAADAARLLSKIEGYANEPAVAVYHMTFYYQLVLPAWFELRGRWSLPAHEALPWIREEDPACSTLLDRFCTGVTAERIDASRAIFVHLFGKSV